MDWVKHTLDFFNRDDGTAIPFSITKDSRTELPPVVVEREGKTIGQLDTNKGLVPLDNATKRLINEDRGFESTLKDILLQEEGFSGKAYVPTRNGKVIGKSGVTIGKGFDIGQFSVNDLKKLGLDDAIVSKLKPYITLKGAAALKRLKKAPLQLEEGELSAISEAVMSNKLDKLDSIVYDLEKKSGRELSDNQKVMIGSMLYQGISPKSFPKAFRAFTKGDYETARKEFLGLDGRRSDWAIKQTPERANRTIEALLRDMSIQEAEEMLVKEGRISPKRRVFWNS